MAAPDPYVTLGLAPTASEDELRTAYRRLVQLHHPDHNNGSRESALRFAEVQEAYAHVRLLRKQQATGQTAQAGGTSSAQGTDPAVEARLASMEQELRAARAQRERAARAAAQKSARTAAREAKASDQGAAGYDEQGHATDEELGYYTTDDSFTKILDDFADQVSARFSEVHPPQQDGPTPKRRPRSVSDWIDEIGSRLTGEQNKKDG